MTVPGAIQPHGGRLVDRHTDKDCSGMKVVQVSAELASDMENIADGIFSPLEGFVGSGDLEGIISKGRLEDGTAWTIPIMLDADAASARSIKDAGEVLLEGPGGQGRAILHAEEEFAFDAAAAARGVFGTDDPKHPGVSKMLSLKERLVSGKIDQVSAPSESELRRHRMTPSQTRQAFSDAGWKSVAAFQTRNPPHVAHEMLQKAALTVRDGVFVNPLVGRKKPGDFADEVIINCYMEMIKKYYPEGRCKMATLHTEMRYAGPKEAIHHAIMRQNYGCTGIIIGRDHAGVGSYYDPFAAHRIFDDYEDLEIEPIFFPAFFYCNDCLAFTNAKGCPHGEASREQISGTKMREMIQAGQSPSKFILRPEVSQIILDHPSPFVK